MTSTTPVAPPAPPAGADGATGHFDLGRYDRLARDVAALKALDWPDPALRDIAVTFVHREARLLDTDQLERWLALFDPDGLYWLPANPDGGDPTREVSLTFDDVRRLGDRVYWLRTGLVMAQTPPSRTRHLLTGVEAVRGAEPGTLLVRCNVALAERRAGVDRIFTGWCGYVLTGAGGAPDVADGAGVAGTAPDPRVLRIRTKVTFLTDADAGHENLTFLF